MRQRLHERYDVTVARVSREFPGFPGGIPSAGGCDVTGNTLSRSKNRTRVDSHLWLSTHYSDALKIHKYIISTVWDNRNAIISIISFGFIALKNRHLIHISVY